MAGLDAGTRIIECPERGKGLRKQPGLHLFCDFQLLGQAPFRFEPLSIRPALRLNLPAHLIGAKQVEGVLIRIAKHRHRAAPQLRLRRMKKTHSTAQPKIVGRKDVFGDESNLSWPPDELVSLRAALRSHHREDRAAIGRRDGHPPAEFKTRLGQHAEAKLIDVELQRSVVVPNKNVGLEQTEVGTLLLGLNCPAPGQLYPSVLRLRNSTLRVQPRSSSAKDVRARQIDQNHCASRPPDHDSVNSRSPHPGNGLLHCDQCRIGPP